MCSTTCVRSGPGGLYDGLYNEPAYNSIERTQTVMTTLTLTGGTHRNGILKLCRSFAVVGLIGLMVNAPSMAAGMPQDDGKKSDKNQPPPPPPYVGPKKRIAIMNKDMDGNTASHSDQYQAFAAQTGTKNADDVGLKLNTMLTTALQSTGRFVIVERQDFGDIKSEQALTDQGQTTAQTGAKKGSILGAEIMVRCAITEFVADSVKEHSGAGVNIGGLSLGGGGGRKKAKVTLDIKMYEVATSKILYTDSASGDSTSQGSGFSIGGATGNFGGAATFGKSTNDPIEKATRDAITNVVNKIIKKMDAIPWEGKVALADKDDDGKMMYVINRGEIDGVHVGDELIITRPGKEIIDPDTGEKLGRSEDKILGTCKVLSTTKNTATIEPAAGLDVKVGAIVKYRQ